MRQSPQRWIAALAGAALVLAGLALAATAAMEGGGLDGGRGSDEGPTASEADRTPPGDPAAPAAASPDPDAPATTAGAAPVPIPTPGTPEPAWRAKQREAEARLLGETSGSGGLGAVAVVSYDPAREAAAAPAAPQTTAPPPAAGPTSRTVGTGGSTPLAGVWAGTAAELAGYLLRTEPAPSFTVSADILAGYYVRYAAEVGLRADVLWAQMLHETGFGRYGGSVRASQNNYAGIGATGGGEPGLTFVTAEAGVMAHVAHMVAYVFTEDRAAWVGTGTDPRYDMVSPRGAARVLTDLDGRWAVPGDGYGEAIERHVRAINGS